MKNQVHPTKHTISVIALIFTAVIWGGGFVACKMGLEGFSPFVMLAYRFEFAAIGVGIIFFCKIVKTPLKTILSGCLLGCTHMTALGIQLIGLEYTTSAKQSFLCTAYVALVPFAAWIISGKRPSLKAVIAGALALTGIGFISLRGDLSINIGDLITLGFPVVFSFHLVLISKFVTTDTDPMQMSFFQFLTAGTIALIISLIRGDNFFTTNLEAWTGVAYLAVLNTLIAFTVQNVAQRYVSGPLSALILGTESVFGFIFSVLYYNEQLTWQILIGAALCFAAILISTVHKKHPELKQS